MWAENADFAKSNITSLDSTNIKPQNGNKSEFTNKQRTKHKWFRLQAKITHLYICRL